MMARDVAGAGAVFLLGGLVAIGCSHSWDLLEPLGGAGGSANTTSTTSTGGAGGDATGTTSSTGVTTTSSAGGAGGATSSNSSSSDASSSSASGTGGGGSTAYYGATFAACNSETNLDPQACEQLFGNGAMGIDAMTSTNLITRGFVRFDLDSKLAGKTIDAVTLRLTTASGNGADSDSSGQIWKVTPFTAITLPMAQPTSIGAAVGMDLGPVLLGTNYYWGLPKDLVAADAPVFLGIDTGSADGVHYWNDHGVVPPLLIVDYH